MRKITEQDILELKFHPSSMGEIMTGFAKKWDVENSLTCKRKLVTIYRELTWERRQSIETEAMEKGTKQEEESISLYSLFKGEMYRKNEEVITNDYFIGIPDIFKGYEIRKAEKITDTKTSKDWTTFPSIVDKLDSDYDWQLQGYFDLTGATEGSVAHCLVNQSGEWLNNKKRLLSFKPDMLSIGGNESEEYIKLCAKLEQDNIYDIKRFKELNIGFEFHTKDWHYDIPVKERVHEFIVKRDDEKIEAMHKRIIECRQWMIKNLLKT